VLFYLDMKSGCLNPELYVLRCEVQLANFSIPLKGRVADSFKPTLTDLLTTESHEIVNIKYIFVLE